MTDWATANLSFLIPKLVFFPYIWYLFNYKFSDLRLTLIMEDFITLTRFSFLQRVLSFMCGETCTTEMSNIRNRLGMILGGKWTIKCASEKVWAKKRWAREEEPTKEWELIQYIKHMRIIIVNHLFFIIVYKSIDCYNINM